MFKGPTTQFQCDEGSAPTTGFSVNSQGQLEYQGKTDFVACETGMNGGLNVYIEESDAVTGCKDVTLSADKCSGSGAGSSPSGSGSSSSSVPAGSSAPSSPAPRPSSSTPAVSSSAQASSPSGWAPVASSSTPAVSSVQVSSSAQASSPSGWAPAPGSSQVSSVPGASSMPASSSMSQVTVWTTKTNYECNSQSTSFPGVPSGTPSSPQSQTVPVSWAPSSSGGSQPSSYPSSSQPGGGSQPSSYPSSSQPGGGSQPSSSQPGGGAQPSGTSSASQPSGTPPSSGKTCPTNLNGEYTAPHLIIPVDSSSPDTAPGTSYNGTISSSLTTLYKFDVPQSYADKTCSLVFLFPKQEDLETSAFTFNGDGKIDFASLESPVSEETSYSNMPGVKEDYGVTTVSPDNHYVISTFQCPAGEAVSYEMKNAGSTYLDFFEDYNPSP